MKFKRIIKSCTAICIAAIFMIAACSCGDLGDYDTVEQYYSSFGDVVLIDGESKQENRYSVEEYFYNKESQDNFLSGEDGAYRGVTRDEYVYMAIPFERNIKMDTISLFLQSYSDVTVYINVYLTSDIPSNLKGIEDVGKEYETEIVYVQKQPEQDTFETETAGNDGEVNSDGAQASDYAEDSLDRTEGEEPTDSAHEADTESEELTDAAYETETEIIKIEYDDPDPETRIGEITVHLKAGEWTSFTLDSFDLNGSRESSVQINMGQYILLQIRNNSGVRVFDEQQKLYVDAQTGIVPQRAEITMTNLMIRALSVDDPMKQQGGE